ncbi:hypothetical protein FEM08_01500 [Flavobacterium gilvum]|nr:hypothetical protein FEM08_01500 [Flavobacterium gilvum]
MFLKKNGFNLFLRIQKRRFEQWFDFEILWNIRSQYFLSEG